MDAQLSRETLAEFIGTFMLILVGAGAVALGGSLEVAAFAHGLILVAIIGTYGHVSGAHVNPAVTLGVWIAGHMPSRKALFYMVAQFLGAIVAAVVLMIIVPESLPGHETLGQTLPAGGVNELDIVLVEGLLTFFLVSTVFQAALYGKGGALAPVLIGFTLAGSILLGGTLTGASLNPARTLGPWLLASDKGELSDLLIYLVAIFAGGALAAFLHMDTFRQSDGVEKPLDAAKRRRNR